MIRESELPRVEIFTVKGENSHRDAYMMLLLVSRYIRTPDKTPATLNNALPHHAPTRTFGTNIHAKRGV